MLQPNLRELRTLSLERPPRRLALVVGLTTALVVLIGTLVLAAQV